MYRVHEKDGFRVLIDLLRTFSVFAAVSFYVGRLLLYLCPTFSDSVARNFELKCARRRPELIETERGAENMCGERCIFLVHCILSFLDSSLCCRPALDRLPVPVNQLLLKMIRNIAKYTLGSLQSVHRHAQTIPTQIIRTALPLPPFTEVQVESLHLELNPPDQTFTALMA